MANSVAVQILHDMSKYTDIKVDLFMDTSNFAYTILIDPAAQYIDPVGNKTTQYRIDQIDFVVGDPVSVDLQWDATVPLSIVELVGRGRWPAVDYHQPLQNNAGAGKTGKIGFVTFGWTAGQVTASFLMKLAKQ